MFYTDVAGRIYFHLGQRNFSLFLNTVYNMGNTEASPAARGWNYILHISTPVYKTTKYGGRIYLILYNDKGEASRPFKYDYNRKFRSNPSRKRRFPISNLQNFNSVVRIELWRENNEADDDIYIDVIEIENCSNGERYLFPLQRWLKAYRHLFLRRNDCCLPQDDPNPIQRKRELGEKRIIYTFHEKCSGIPPRVEKLPADESFADEHTWEILRKKYDILSQSQTPDITSTEWNNLHELHDVYNKTFPLPEGIFNWRQDSVFGMQRLSGCNPTMIKLCTEIPYNFGVTEEMARPMLENLTLEEAIKQQRLFICNLRILDKLPCAGDRKICAPMCLFFVTAKEELIPIAIQLNQEMGPDNPVFLPTDPEYTWMLAKMYYNNADAAIHQAFMNLAVTRMLVESFAICCHRNLSPSHPVFRLLAPHFFYTMATNNLSLDKLLCLNGWIDRYTTIGRVGTLELIRRMWSEWRLDVQGTLPNDLLARGVTSPTVLPNYRYRDDAMLVYNAIYNYVTKVVEGHYDSKRDLINDQEIQAWATDLVSESPGGCGIKGFPGNGQFSRLDDLVQTLTSIIYTSSVNHSVVNSQYDFYGFPACYPSILRGNPPTNKDSIKEEEILQQLPDRVTTLNIMVGTGILSEKSTKALGNFEIRYQYDAVGQNATEEFTKELVKVGKLIDARNKQRMQPYLCLHPSCIPNAPNM